MRNVDRPALTAYLTVVNEVTQTTRRASEDFLDCPDVSIVRRGQDEVRNFINLIYDGLAIDHVVAEGDLRQIYWDLVQRAKPISVHFGASDFDALDDYFVVDDRRASPNICDQIESSHRLDTIPRMLLDAVRTYESALNIPLDLAARVAIVQLGRCLPEMAAIASQLRDGGASVRAASTAAFEHFKSVDVVGHVVAWGHLKNNLIAINGMAGKPGAYPSIPAMTTRPQPLLLELEDARGIMSVYTLQKMGYSPTELKSAHRLAKNPLVQEAIVAFQLGVMAHSLSYIQQTSDPLSLLPITEFFVIAPNITQIEKAIAPNPKLIQVVCNNVLPGVASVLYASGSDQLTSHHIAEGVRLAVRKKVFHMQIGEFSLHDVEQRTVELRSMFPRTCPAMPMLSMSLERWLPQLFDQLNAVRLAADPAT